MRRADWTPVVLITASLSVTVVLGTLATTPWIRDAFRSTSRPEVARRELASRVDVWVGEVAPGVTGVLSPVWGEPGPDREHDAQLNADLGVTEGAELAFYHLLLFNTSEDDQTVQLGDGALTIQPPGEGPAVPLRSIAALVARGDVEVPPALVPVLGARGTLQDEVAVPGGWMADLLVAFARRVPLGTAREVASARGAAFARRPTTRTKLDALVETPDVEGLEDL